MQPTLEITQPKISIAKKPIEITPTSIKRLLPQFLGVLCLVESFTGRGTTPAFLLRINGRRYRINWDTLRVLIRDSALPANLAIPIIDYTFEHDVFKRKEGYADLDMICWL